jgi:hypothetical protein
MIGRTADPACETSIPKGLARFSPFFLAGTDIGLQSRGGRPAISCGRPIPVEGHAGPGRIDQKLVRGESVENHPDFQKEERKEERQRKKKQAMRC